MHKKLWQMLQLEFIFLFPYKKGQWHLNKDLFLLPLFTVRNMFTFICGNLPILLDLDCASMAFCSCENICNKDVDAFENHMRDKHMLWWIWLRLYLGKSYCWLFNSLFVWNKQSKKYIHKLSLLSTSYVLSGVDTSHWLIAKCLKSNC